MQKCPNCGSYAVNDDPLRVRCDRCWRDAAISGLRQQVAELQQRVKELEEGCEK